MLQHQAHVKKLSNQIKVISAKEAEDINIQLENTVRETPVKYNNFEEIANQEASDPDIFEHKNEKVNLSYEKSKNDEEEDDENEITRPKLKKDYLTDVATMKTEQFAKNKVPEFQEIKVKSKLEQGFVNPQHNLHQPTGNSQSRLEKQTADRRVKEDSGGEDEKSESDFGDIEFADVSDE